MPANVPSIVSPHIERKCSSVITDDAASFLDEANHQMGGMTLQDVKSPPDSKAITALVSPPTGCSVSSTSSSGSYISEEDTNSVSSSSSIANMFQSDHKKAEIAGRHVPEPLLVENPHRFVIFPIQDAEVCSFLVCVPYNETCVSSAF